MYHILNREDAQKRASSPYIQGHIKINIHIIFGQVAKML